MCALGSREEERSDEKGDRRGWEVKREGRAEFEKRNGERENEGIGKEGGWAVGEEREGRRERGQEGRTGVDKINRAMSLCAPLISCLRGQY